MQKIILAAAVCVSLAALAAAQTKVIPGETKTATATIEAIERSTREVTVKDDKGQFTTIVVPIAVTRFDAMKVGDTITMRYYDNVVLRVKLPGEKSVDTDTAALAHRAGEKPGGTLSTQRAITATITHIDPKVPSITFTGPNKWTYSSRVQDTEALKKVKVGDKVDITWTEAVMISVDTPAPKQ